jgi:hypothetical protein
MTRDRDGGYAGDRETGLHREAAPARARRASPRTSRMTPQMKPVLLVIGLMIIGSLVFWWVVETRL